MSPPSRVYASSGKANSDEADKVAADARRTPPPPMAEEPRRPVAATPREVWTKARRERDRVLGLVLPLAVMDRRDAAAVGLLKGRGGGRKGRARKRGHI